MTKKNMIELLLAVQLRMIKWPLKLLVLRSLVVLKILVVLSQLDQVMKTVFFKVGRRSRCFETRKREDSSPDG